MRPSDDPRRLIERLTREGVGDAAHALWFGSRTDGTRRGRDIDLRGESRSCGSAGGDASPGQRFGTAPAVRRA